MPGTTGSNPALLVPAAGSVGNVALADDAVDQRVLAALSVGTPELINLAVTLAKLAANSVDSSKIVDGSIVAADISATAAILGSQLAAAAGITGAQLAAAAGITGAQLAAAAGITGAQLAAAAGITGAQLASAAAILGTQIATGGQLVKQLLRYSETTDILNGSSAVANTQTIIKGGLNFTVGDATSVVLFSVAGSMFLSGGASPAQSGTSILIDGATRIMLGGSPNPTSAAGGGCNPFAGTSPVGVTGLSVGAHTMEVDYQSSQTQTANVYLRAATLPQYEHLEVTVVEFKRQ